MPKPEIREFSTQQLNKLSKKELIHFLISFDVDIEKIVKDNIIGQQSMGIKCFECLSIAKKLEIKI